jgi:carboxyl-terminal processing protease
MTKKSFYPLFLLIGIGVFFSFKIIANRSNSFEGSENSAEINVTPFQSEGNEQLTKNEAIMLTIMQLLKEGHYSPKELNDDFSKKVFAEYMKMTDYGKVFLLQSDVDGFQKHETTIDDELQNGSTALFDEVNKVISMRMKNAEIYYKEAVKMPFTFDGKDNINIDNNEDDEIELDGKKLAFCKSEAELKTRWLKSVKYRVLARITELKEQQKTTTDEKLNVKSVDTLMKESRESVQKNLANYFKRLYKINESDRYAVYMNSICHVLDPHTDFFPPKDKQRFDEEMSGSFFGIGAVLQSEEGVCKIKQVVTGSPCWKEGKLKVNDIILKVAQGVDDPVEISGWDIEDVVSIIRGKEGSEVRLTTKHLDGDIEVIKIIRGKVETEATFAKSTIIKNNNHKIGYIMLPEFYANFQERNGRRCAVDMAKEVEKLKKENVQGIIIDLRNNGGGSLSDVVEIGGMFIDKGPIVQVKSKDAPSQSLNDRETGTLYDGPLAILINQGSASASEILAAAMQDYKRAIILGTTSFGKGTVQRVFPLEDFYKGDPSLLPFGSIKLTLQKFYRINGGSTQLKGVTPDIMLPDMYDLVDMGERKDENSMAWDQIAKADYKVNKSSVDFIPLIDASKKRANANESFNIITKNAKRLKQQFDDNRYSLNEKKYIEQMKETKDLAKKMEDLNKNKKVLPVSYMAVDLPNFHKDTTSTRMNDEWLKIVGKDTYIAEAANVLSDWIVADKKNTVGKK